MVITPGVEAGGAEVVVVPAATVVVVVVLPAVTCDLVAVPQPLRPASMTAAIAMALSRGAPIYILRTLRHRPFRDRCVVWMERTGRHATAAGPGGRAPVVQPGSARLSWAPWLGDA